jgi:hypothetical protein
MNSCQCGELRIAYIVCYVVDFRFPTTQNGVFVPRLPSSLADNQQHSTHLPSLLSPSLTGSQLLGNVLITSLYVYDSIMKVIQVKCFTILACF